MHARLILPARLWPVFLIGLLPLAPAFTSAARAQGVNQPRSLTVEVLENDVTLRWLEPVSVSQPLTGYLVEAGTSPGTTLVSLPLGNVLALGVTAPSGVYYVRVRALFGATPGPPSDEIQVLVNVTPPAAPENLTAAVAHLAVTFSWAIAAGTPSVNQWQLQAGSAPGLSDLAVVSLPGSLRTFTASAPVAGTYYIRMVALNGAGAGPPSAELAVVTGPGICDLPRTPTGLAAIAGDGGVRLRWDSPAAPFPAGYLLAAGFAPGASDVGVFTLPTRNSLATFAPAGTYYVRLAAFNVCGSTPNSPDLVFTVTPPSNASLIGTWSGTVSNYTKPYPWTPITSFQLTLNANPTEAGGSLPGLWIDNKGCQSTLISGAINIFPVVSIEQLSCNDGDLILTITSRTATVVEGRCNAGPNCSFRMTRH
jgi:hypothetical protein